MILCKTVAESFDSLPAVHVLVPEFVCFSCLVWDIGPADSKGESQQNKSVAFVIQLLFPTFTRSPSHSKKQWKAIVAGEDHSPGVYKPVVVTMLRITDDRSQQAAVRVKGCVGVPLNDSRASMVFSSLTTIVL